jgi:DNA-binding SARP family transcriptional activator
MLAALRVRILGPLQVEGLAPSALGSRKQRSLLRVLALGRGGPVNVDRLADCLWSERLPARPADEIGVLVSRLRSVLGTGRVARSDAGYRLVADWIDLVVLEQLVDEAERRLTGGQPAPAATAAQAGLSLVMGPLLADETDAPWADEARRMVERTITRLQLVAAEASLKTGDPFGASVAAQTVLDHDPYDEQALRLLMTAHARAGRPGAALSAYAKTREALVDDLGANTSSLTEALHLAILRDEIAPMVPLPGPTGQGHPVLAGRDREWSALDGAYARAQGGVEVVIVEGEAGMGKTRLLEAWSSSISPTATVLSGTCDPVGTLPLQAVLDALDGRLARTDEAGADELRARAGPVLAPLLRGYAGPPAVPDPLTAQAALFAGALAVCGHAAGNGVPVLVLDDVHLADATTMEWVRFAARRPRAGPLLIVLARRPAATSSILGATRIPLGPLDLGAVAEIVGDERAPALLERSGGNPLFLVELAGLVGEELPISMLEAIAARCAQAGQAGPVLRTAAVLGPEVDLDLLAAVMQQPAVGLLSDLEEGQRLMILEERGTTLCFRHELVREALVASTGAARRALAHREAARMLAQRPRRDPLAVAAHARQGGDLELAAGALVEAASVALARFDVREAERLLDVSIELWPLSAAYLARGRARLTGENFAGASADAAQALEMGAGAESLELASWAAYYRRDFDTARLFCGRAEAELQARPVITEADNVLKRSVLALAGRIAHADGLLDVAQGHLESAFASASATGGAGVAGVWLGWLMADRGRAERAGDLATRAEADGSLTVHPFASAHRALLAGYTSALRGRVDEALSFLDIVDREVELRHLEHFVGRTANYRAWLLRNLLCDREAVELNLAAADVAQRRGLREPQAQSALDLADAHLRSDELSEAAAALGVAASLGAGYAFSWKARLRGELLAARLALADGRPQDAVALACATAEEALRLGSPRYATLARVVGARARSMAGEHIDPVPIGSLIEDLTRFAAPEAWWATAELARDLGVDQWWGRAEEAAGVIAMGAGPRGPEFRLQAGRWLDKTRSSRFRS